MIRPLILACALTATVLAAPSVPAAGLSPAESAAAVQSIVYPPPVAAFVYTPAKSASPATVEFNASRSYDLRGGGRVVSYAWDFGDGATETQDHPQAVHTYGPGRWKVVLTVTNDKGRSDTTTAVVQSGGPVAPIRVLGDPNEAAPLTVPFYSHSWDLDGRPIVSYLWDVDNGLPAVLGGPGMTHTFGAGRWNVGLTVVNDQGLRDSARVVVRASCPIALFDPIPSGWRARASFWFWARSASFVGGTTTVKWDWDFGDGTTATIDSPYPISHTYAEGDWTVTLTATDALGMTDEMRTSFEVLAEDHVPTVSIPASVVTKAGEPIVIPFTVEDLEGDEIETLMVSPSPVGSSFVTAPDRTSGVFSWTPTPADVGTFRLSIRPTAHGTGVWYPILVSVWSDGLAPNLAPNPSFESDLNGWGPYAGSLVERVLEGHDGSCAVQVTGPDTLNGSFGLNDSPDVIQNTLGAGLCYRFTTWVRSPSARGTARLRIREYGGNPRC